MIGMLNVTHILNVEGCNIGLLNGIYNGSYSYTDLLEKQYGMVGMLLIWEEQQVILEWEVC